MTKEETACPGHNASGSVYRKKALEPFVHQVSGRAHMLSLDPSTICKSLSTREWKFYNELPISLKNFTPRLKGLLFVHLEKESGCSHRFMSLDVWMSSESASNSVNNFNVNKKDKNGGQGTQVLSFKSPEMTCWNRSFECFVYGADIGGSYSSILPSIPFPPATSFQRDCEGHCNTANCRIFGDILGQPVCSVEKTAESFSFFCSFWQISHRFLFLHSTTVLATTVLTSL